MHLCKDARGFAVIQFYATADYECSYLPNRKARSHVAAPSHLINHDSYSGLVREGFRRSGSYVYRPYCDECQACVPLRILTHVFEPTRSQKRAWTKHENLKIRITKPYFVPEHYELYLSYQKAQHAGSNMSQDSVTQYSQFLLNSRVNTRLVEFVDADSGALRMVTLMDVVEDGLSAVYTFFDTTQAKSSFGTFSILWLIEQAKNLALPYVYLGYWIEQTHKMSYKNLFQPNEKRIGLSWQ
jgi:leucyl-tRNA---protein transferase